MLTIGSLNLDRPVLLAPMEDITDRPFRRLARRFGASIVYTEFISSEGLIRSVAKTRSKAVLSPDEHPVGIQIYGNREEAMVEAARLSEAVGPDLLDLNFGCPARKVACKKAGVGAGAGLLRDPDLLLSITRSVIRAVSIPVTVKTRLGWDDSSIIILDLARRLEDAGVAALTLHARTRCQGYKWQADWSWIARVKQALSIPVIGNGDVREPEDALRMFRETGCDGVMIGRGAMGNPWIFSRTRSLLDRGIDPGPPDIRERVGIYLEMMDSAVSEKGERRGVLEMRSHFSGYLKGVPHISDLRAAIMTQTTVAGIQKHIGEFLSYLRTGVVPEWFPQASGGRGVSGAAQARPPLRMAGT